MANIRVLEDGPRNYVIAVQSIATEDVLLVDVSTLTPPASDVSLLRISYDVAPGDSAAFAWDATIPVESFRITEGNGQTICFKSVGGITNPMVAAGSTGDVRLITTVSAPPRSISMLLHFRKKY